MYKSCSNCYYFPVKKNKMPCMICNDEKSQWVSPEEIEEKGSMRIAACLFFISMLIGAGFLGFLFCSN